MFATLIPILVFTQEPERLLFFLTYALIIEGGLALATGGTIASFSPIIGKIGETVFHSRPYDSNRLREAERQARVWIVTGTILFLLGLLASAF